MKDKKIIYLVLLVLVSAFVNFYMTNLFLSDVANMYDGFELCFISTIPGLFLAMDLVLATIYFVRYYLYPQYFKKMTKTYSVILIVFSLIGLVFSLLTGIISYGSFIAPYPFVAYPLICLIIHLLLLVFALWLRIYGYKRLADDEVERKMTIRHILGTIGLVLVIYFALNRLGAFLWSPVYLHYRSLYMTFPFYLALLLPIAILFHLLISKTILKDKFKASIIYCSLVMFFDIVLAIIVVYLGTKDTQFISAVSPAVGLERLMTKPLTTIIHFPLVFFLGLYSLIRVLIENKKKALV